MPLRKKELKAYQYREAGLDNIVLHRGVLEAACPKGHETLIAIQGEAQLLQVIALSLFMRKGFLSGKEIKYAREACDLTQAELAKVMQLNRRETIAEWESEKSPRRDVAAEFLLRAVLVEEFKLALETKVPNHLSPSHFKLLHAFQEAFVEAYKLIPQTERKNRREEIQVRRNEYGVWTPERIAA